MGNEEYWDVPLEGRRKAYGKVMHFMALCMMVMVCHFSRQYLYIIPKSSVTVSAIDSISMSAPVVGRENGRLQESPTQKATALHFTEEIIEVDEEVVPIDESPYIYYNIPLSDSLQEYTQELCAALGVYFPLVLATMEEESRFDESAISPINENGTRDWGIMQINEGNHPWLKDELGVTDMMDPHQNILCGVYILSLYNHFGDDYQTISMWYNWPSKAKELGAIGEFTPYSERVMIYLADMEGRAREVAS